ncbi:MAG: riboflavin biosynthesis protein RibF [Candidatus Melainabacteria bacterium RIFOXYA12_FULL_32_12]|nr:MAG: riboflavin biosynthesis protein RibF [Candidatus Melainabacteria bacterium GWF2_32_7]OGI17259.1 MAG: riboflavin biosynthesis protein RibF [Candidatus Melainabacteria bacterium RIFOXYA2_FULL_32_9]OGI24223.1 MAG: riboflavin biosynthesis protein RibF [Candidatus Melainabacteria bacterium RIFOXYA12_FULL_32_12]
MLVFREIKPNLIPASCLAQGVFDGVHLGHQKVIIDAIEKSRTTDALATVVTFANHPQYITSKNSLKLITNLEDRLELFEALGVQVVLLLDFTEELSKISAVEYIKSVLVEGLNVRHISIGYNHRFGSQKKGDHKLLEKYGEQYGYKVTVIPPVAIEGQVASSSDIRNLISSGDVDSASKLLGRPFSIKGAVIQGKRRGTQLGFPTANMELPENMISPAAGVYSGLAYIGNENYFAVINVGKRPTFGDLTVNLVEAHVLNYSGNLYHKNIEVAFLKKLRDEKRFASEAELVEQIKLDCQAVTVLAPNL